MQFSHQLVSHSLRCDNAAQLLLSDVTSRNNENIVLRDDNSHDEENTAYAGAHLALAAVATSLYSVSTPSISTPSDQNTGRLLQTSKISHCARDLVAPCRKCGTVVCRNCIAKPPSDKCLVDRYRRLCMACLSAPLTDHLRPLKKDDGLNTTEMASASCSNSICSHRSSSVSQTSASSGLQDTPLSPCFTAPAFSRAPCTCATRGVHLCSTCGASLRASDTTYRRVWTWRSRYSTHIGGGLGTGLGEGDQGQKCARARSCLSDIDGGGVCWVEVDCGDEAAQDYDEPSSSDTAKTIPDDTLLTPIDPFQEPRFRGRSCSITPSTPMSHDRPGYHSQEMEGIGGVVKKKVKKRVKVGATVWEFDDERETGRYLEREASGKLRSWCGWCDRVVPGAAEHEEVKRLRLIV